ncbi:MAG: carbohydrate binding domain-containing protein, partial [Oscillospiraceae bacterium]|nr:carbohydrate binding domain-containing protein [Oscillospiraceae bacterium]
MVNFKRFCAALSAIALTTGTFAVFQTTSVQQLSADTVYAAGESVANVNGGSAIYGLYRAADANGYYMYYDMESDTAAFSARGGCTLGAGDAYKGNKGLGVSGRQEEWNGIMIPLDSAVFSAGNEYSFSAAYRGAADATFKMTLQYSLAGTESYDEITSSAASAGTYTVLSNPNYRIPAGASDLTLVFETTDSPCDFSIDEVIVAEAGTKPGASVSDTSGTPGDLDGDGKINVADFVLFKSGMVSNWTAEGIKNSANADVDRSTEVNAEDA